MVPNDYKGESMPSRVPAPSHRHAAPSGPWPWMDLSSVIDPNQLTDERPPVPKPCDHSECEGKCWIEYPQSRFPNWTPDQVNRAKIGDAVLFYDREQTCTVYIVDVDKSGLFRSREPKLITEKSKGEFWDNFLRSKREDNIRVRSFFLENMTGPVLQMFGAKYNVEPFFFSSSLHWIPSRYQEALQPKQGDHITITLTFLSTAPNPLRGRPSRTTTMNSLAGSVYAATPRHSSSSLDSDPWREDDQVIDTQAPLAVRTMDGDHRILLLDLLAIHIVRSADSSTIISYHPNRDQTDDGQPTYVIDRHGHHHHARVPPTTRHNQETNGPRQGPGLQSRRSTAREIGTTASHLSSRIRFAGQSVYWQNIFSKSQDPTFLVITYLWHALYAWDEALETLYKYVCWLETRVITTSEMGLTRELHIIRAHHLHYSSLLDDFAKSVRFVMNTPNPAMDADSVTEEERQQSAKLLKVECENLLLEIARLQKGRKMQDQRLKNVMNLVFSSVNIDDSRRMQRLTEAAVKDSAAMKQIAYLTMFFLPASFLAAVFGMNVKEVTDGGRQTVPHYVAGALVLTFVTIWVIMTFQSEHWYEDPNSATIFHRMAWPYFWMRKFLNGLRQQRTTRPKGEKGDIPLDSRN